VTLRFDMSRAICAFALGVTLAACGTPSDAAELPLLKRARAQQQQRGASPAPATFVEHPENVQPGLTLQRQFTVLRNPFEGDKQRVTEGEALFVSYNCADCHGAGGSGAMGPSLADGRWHFGGTAGEVFQSIYEGRPEGMPAWGGRIADDQIWRLVAYVQSLGVGKDLSTENFTGRTIEKMGH
jgi:cytochrome c oxidase cbb3-type subunit 3